MTKSFPITSAASAALAVYDHINRQHGVLLEESVTDLITDLLHIVDAGQGDAEKLALRCIQHFTDERTE